MAATLALSESEAVIALGSRTTMLHPEMKRHRAWWREILSSEVPKKLAGRASSSSSSSADAKESSSSSPLLVDGERHAHVELLEDLGVFLSEGRFGAGGGGGAGGTGEVLGALAAVVGEEAGSDLESKELAAVICGCGGEAGTTRLVWKPLRVDPERRPPKRSLEKALSGNGLKALGLTATKLARDDWVGLSGEAYEIRRAPNHKGSGDEGGGGNSGRVVLHYGNLTGEVARLVAQVKRAKSWNDRHPACFLPVSWAVCAALSAKWPRVWGGGGAALPGQGKPLPLSPGDAEIGGAGQADAKRPSLFSVLALLAAFLDKESTSRGVSKEIFGVGPKPTFARQNPNIAELFLRFCSFVRKVGIGESPPTLRLLGDGELDHQQQKQKNVPRGAEMRQLEEGRSPKNRPILVKVDDKLLEDLADTRLASRLRRACGAVERSLIPDEVRGLSVWGQDIRWSLLGFALERTGGSSPGKDAAAGGGAKLPSYLDWMEVGLQMCMKEDIDEMPGMYGFSVTGRIAPPSPAGASRLDAEHASDVARARSADVAFCASIEASGSAGKGIAAAAPEEDSDVSMEDDSSDNLGRGREQSGSGGTDSGEEDGIDGVPMDPLLPPSGGGHGVQQPPPATAMELEEQGVHGASVTLPLPPPSMPRPPDMRDTVPSAAQAGIAVEGASVLPPTVAAVALGAQLTRDGGVDDYAEARAPHPTAEGRRGTVETVLARGDMVMREAAEAVAAARATAVAAAADDAAVGKTASEKTVSPTATTPASVGAAAPTPAAAAVLFEHVPVEDAGGGATTRHGGSERDDVGNVGSAAAATTMSVTLPLKKKGQGAEVEDSSQGKAGGPGGNGGDDTDALREVEEAVRERAKALAKERGRERGKQRAEEREAEKEAERERQHKIDTAREERLLKRKRETENRASIRQEKKWSKEVKERCENDKKLEFARRASAMDEARAEDLAAKKRLPRERSTSKVKNAPERKDGRSSSTSASRSTSNSRSSSARKRSTRSRGRSGIRSGNRGSSGGGRGNRGGGGRRGGSGRARGSRYASSSDSGSRSRNRRHSRSHSHSRSRSNSRKRMRQRSRGAWHNRRSPSPRCRNRSSLPVGGDSGSRGSSHAHDVTAPSTANDGENRLPSPAAWSAWRSVSSGDSSDSPEADDLAAKGGDVRSVTRGNVSGGGFRIQLRRGASLEKPNDESDRQENQASTRRVEEYHGGRSPTLGSSGEKRPNLSGARRRHDDDDDDDDVLERGSSHASKSRGPYGSFEEMALSLPARKHRDSADRSPRRGRNRPTSSEQRGGETRREIDPRRVDLGSRVGPRAGGRERSRSREGRRSLRSPTKKAEREGDSVPRSRGLDERERSLRERDWRARSRSRDRSSPSRREGPRRPRRRSPSRQRRGRSRSRSRSNPNEQQKRQSSRERPSDGSLLHGRAPKAVRIDAIRASETTTSAKTRPIPKRTTVSRTKTRAAGATAPKGAVALRPRDRKANGDAVDARKEKGAVGKATTVATPALGRGGPSGGSSKPAWPTPVKKNAKLGGASARAAPAPMRVAVAGQGKRGASAAERGIGARPEDAAHKLAESSDEIEEGEVSMTAMVATLAATAAPARKAVGRSKQLPARDRQPPNRQRPPPGQPPRASQPAPKVVNGSSSAMDKQPDQPVHANQPAPAGVATSTTPAAVDQLPPAGQRPPPDQPTPDAADISKSAVNDQPDRPAHPGQPPPAGNAESSTPAAVHQPPPAKQTPNAAGGISSSAVGKRPDQPVVHPNQPAPLDVVTESTTPSVAVERPPPAGQLPASDHPVADAANVSISTADSQSGHQPLRGAAASPAADVAGSTTLKTGQTGTKTVTVGSRKWHKQMMGQARRKGKAARERARYDHFANDPLARSSTAGGAAADTDTGEDQKEDGVVKGGRRSESTAMIPAPDHPAADAVHFSSSTVDSQLDNQPLRLGQPVAAAAAATAADVAGSTATTAAACFPGLPAPYQPPPPGELAPDDSAPPKKGRRPRNRPSHRARSALSQRLAAETAFRHHLMVGDPSAGSSTARSSMAGGAAVGTGGDDHEEDGAVKGGGAGAGFGRNEPVLMPAPDHPAADAASVSSSSVDSQSDHQPLRLGQPVAAAAAAADVAGSPATPAAVGLPGLPAPYQLPPPGELAPDDSTPPKKGRKPRKRPNYRKKMALSLQLAAEAAGRAYSMVNDTSAGSFAAGNSMAGGAAADTDTGNDHEEDGAVKGGGAGAGTGDGGSKPTATTKGETAMSPREKRGRQRQ